MTLGTKPPVAQECIRGRALEIESIGWGTHWAWASSCVLSRGTHRKARSPCEASPDDGVEDYGSERLRKERSTFSFNCLISFNRGPSPPSAVSPAALQHSRRSRLLPVCWAPIPPPPLVCQGALPLPGYLVACRCVSSFS